MTKQELAARIWATANELRKNIKASEYKDYILGFMFYKYLCDKEVDYLTELGGEIEDLQDVDEEIIDKFKDGIGYYISYKDLFHTWKESSGNLGAKDVAEALEHFYDNLNDRYRAVFENVFSALQTGLTKLGENAGSRDKAVRDIIDLVALIPPTSRDYDVLGYIYEYLIQQFSSEAKKDGSFYTPHELTSLMSRIVAYRLKDKEEITCYDPTVGSGGLLLNIGKEVGRYVPSDNIRYFGQELITETANLAKMNLFMQGVPVQNICMRCANTLEEDWPYFDEQTSYSPLFVDAVTSNPPYSAHFSPELYQTDERYKGYGLAPAGKADYAFLLHCLYHVKNDGVMAIVLPHGVLFRGDSEKEIRKNLILNHNIETIIGFPPQLFFATPIPVIVMILSKNRQSDDILFIDASQSYRKGKKQNVLAESDVQRIFDAVIARKEVPNYAHLATLEEIEENDYNLNIPRYVSAKKQEAPYDLFSVMTGKVSDKELEAFNSIWNQFPLLREKLLKKDDEHTGYNDFKDVDINDVVFSDEDVQDFLNKFHESTDNFSEFLTQTLINHDVTPDVYHEIVERIFDTYKEYSLVDTYNVLQAFADNWLTIESDILRIESEGWNICTETEPNKITKKDSKTKKIVEEQKGVKGKIIPLNLVKSAFFADDFDEMYRLTAEADSKASEYSEIWENMDEDAKGTVCKDNDETAFDTKKFKSAIKSGTLDVEAVESLNAIQDAIAKEKALRKKVKTIASELDDKAEKKITLLNSDEVNNLLERKWIIPTTESISSVGNTVITNFLSDFKMLKKKYSNPLSDISTEIEEVDSKLTASLKALVGNDTDMEAVKMLLEVLE